MTSKDGQNIGCIHSHSVDILLFSDNVRVYSHQDLENIIVPSLSLFESPFWLLTRMLLERHVLGPYRDLRNNNDDSEGNPRLVIHRFRACSTQVSTLGLSSSFQLQQSIKFD